eukprot:gnl/TRDRNA2_/TRDRNA2_36363_c0_seq1.p1 gnl/TRDRNA2_/TRDRNA2_36363_c0~~gnl/TRDRNA2_/TRDRNA2_36363_c0_seq1.p1  ORF type:complete len:428 (-),score=58.99 gnl/TRDRNA2_/TRDRNA2_36363_c0_seq1:19-1302(-)
MCARLLLVFLSSLCLVPTAAGRVRGAATLSPAGEPALTPPGFRGMNALAHERQSQGSSAGSAVDQASEARRLYDSTSMSEEASAASETLQPLMSQKQACDVIAQYLDHPALCQQGRDRFSNKELQKHISKFLTTFRLQRFMYPKHCCTGLNHEYAVSFLIEKLKPMAIIESGVSAGHGTFFLRTSAGLTTPIFALDPLEPQDYETTEWKFYKDTAGPTEYYTGEKFTDFSDIDWGKLIPDAAVRAQTLVVFDDHQAVIGRMRTMQKWGFKWALFEDNYPFYMATSHDNHTCKSQSSYHPPTRDWNSSKHGFGDSFSPNAVCGAMPPASVTSMIYKDNFGDHCLLINRKQYQNLVHYMQRSMVTYFEFPPLFTMCPTRRAPLLAPDPSVLKGLGLPSPMHEIWSYGHFFPAFIEISLEQGDPGDPLAQ